MSVNWGDQFVYDEIVGTVKNVRHRMGKTHLTLEWEDDTSTTHTLEEVLTKFKRYTPPPPAKEPYEGDIIAGKVYVIRRDSGEFLAVTVLDIMLGLAIKVISPEGTAWLTVEEFRARAYEAIIEKREP